VYLQGVVPSESEHQILLQILKDFMGLNAIIDLLQIDELLWLREDRTPGLEYPMPNAGERFVLGIDELTEEPFESEEMGLVNEPPDRPFPERE